jgi:predicted RND superfamily exporter protein
LIQYNEFRKEFGRDERIAVAIKSDKIFTLEFLNNLKALHEDIEKKVPYIEDVTSLYNVRNTRGDGDLLITDDLLEPMPKSQIEVDSIKKRAMESHFYKDLLISKDGKMTVIMIETDTYSHIGEKKVSVEDEFADGFEESEATADTKDRVFLSDMENKELLDKLHSVIKKYQKDGLEIYIAGSPAVNNALKSQMRADMQKFTKITFLIIIIFLFIMFKRASAVFYPLLVIIFSLLTTIGTMAWAGVAFKLPTQIVPSLLLAVSVGATVHILSIFFDRFNSKGSRKDAIIFVCAGALFCKVNYVM